MIRKAVGALTGLGLIGGAGTVAYNHNGDATIRIKDSAGHVRSVQIASSGASFSCPSGTHDQLAPYDIKAGRIKLTLMDVRQAETRLERRYPARNAPHAAVVRYDALLEREHRLVIAFNSVVDDHNALLHSVCTRADSSSSSAQ